MSEKAIEIKSAKAVEDIIKDLTDRRGLRQAWEEIDDEIKTEIINKWVDIVYDYMY
jgi:hypothetical protein